MLCDEVYQYLEYDPLGRKIVADAHKFILTEEFFEVAANISKSNEDTLALKHLFRLPHNPLWLEPRPRHLFNCGIIMEQYNKEQCLSLQRQLPQIMHPIEDAIQITQMPPCAGGIPCSWIALPHTLKLCDDGVLAITVLGVNNQLSGEVLHQLGRESGVYGLYLAVLNSRNLIETESSDLAQLNRARQRRGKLPLFDHKVIRIRRDIKQMMCEAESTEDKDAIGVRAHWRRGHFKIRKTGVFWWSPHMAGNTELGQIEKKYVA